MAEITKYNVYLNEKQVHKLVLLAAHLGKTPEEVINDTVYSYLAIVDPYAIDYDDMTADQKAEADREYIEWCIREGLE